MWCKQKRPTKTMTHQMQMKSNHKRIVNPFTFSCGPNSLDLNSFDLNSFESFPCDDIWIFMWQHLSQRRWCNHVDVLMFFYDTFFQNAMKNNGYCLRLKNFDNLRLKNFDNFIESSKPLAKKEKLEFGILNSLTNNTKKQISFTRSNSV